MGAVAGALSGWPEVAPRGWDDGMPCAGPGAARGGSLNHADAAAAAAAADG